MVSPGGWCLLEELCGGHGGHGGHGDGGHSDVSEDGLAATGGRHLVLAQGADDHLPHLPAGVAPNGQQGLDVLLPAGVDGRTDARWSAGRPPVSRLSISPLLALQVVTEGISTMYERTWWSMEETRKAFYFEIPPTRRLSIKTIFRVTEGDKAGQLHLAKSPCHTLHTTVQKSATKH